MACGRDLRGCCVWGYEVTQPYGCSCCFLRDEGNSWSCDVAVAFQAGCGDNMGHLRDALLTFSGGPVTGRTQSSFLFGLGGSKEEDVEGPSLPTGDCPKLRPAQLSRASCPGVGAEMEIRRREGLGKDNGGCPAQPPACCEAARRAEAAAKMVQDQIRLNPFLRWMQMRQMPLAMLLVPPYEGKTKVPQDFL
eukprot:symbB.v1.2.018210.t1/scaffold1445.1/size118272/1